MVTYSATEMTMACLHYGCFDTIIVQSIDL